LKLNVESVIIERETSRICPSRADADDMIETEVSVDGGSWGLGIGD